ncbi:MAG: hypothetical protein WC929_04790 [Bacilli bacterium]
MKKFFLSKRLRNQLKLLAVVLFMNMFNIGCSVNGTSQIVNVSDSIFIVNINAKTSTPEKPVSLELNAGTYHVSVIGVSEGGAYDAWKAWFHKEKKNDKGDLKFGWINKYSYSSNEFPEVTYFDSIIYETPSLALANAKNSKFILKKKTVVNFYITDSPRIDNTGGISLRISNATLSN